MISKVLIIGTLFVVGCADHETSMNRSNAPGNLGLEGMVNIDRISYWDGSESTGQPRIVIDLDQQRAYFYKSDQLVGVSVVSTGREGYDTPPGEFRVTEKDRAHVSSIYGDYVDQSGQVVVQNVEFKKDPRPRGTIFRGAPMPYFLRIHQGIGMHAGYLPGYPASHGCIRLPDGMAIQFFKNAAVGTPVEVRHASVRSDEPSPINAKYSTFSSLLDQ